ncbi:uncharacterized protein LOC111266123 isoform X2 [Varroa jacobsoni]|nr:uncharacterized protein LOC111266123 isoform X2 [Varroa jacobsoni]
MLWQQGYQDCTEERALGLLCGYPLCDNPVSPPSKKCPQYKICIRTNKVFKMESRRLFCSAWCYKASEWIKRQLSEVPHWLIEEPYNKPLDILKNENLQIRGDIKNEQTDSYVAKANLHIRAAGHELDVNPDCVISSPRRVTFEEFELDKCVDTLENVAIEKKRSHALSWPQASIIQPVMRLRENSVSPKPPSQAACEHQLIMGASRLEALLCEWITISTLHYIVGQDRFLELRAKFDKGKSKPISIEHEEYLLKYERLCRFLDEQDRLEGITYDDGDYSNTTKKSVKAIQRKPRRGPSKKAIELPDSSPIITGDRTTVSATVVGATNPTVASTIDNENAKTAVSTDIAEPVLPPVDKHQRHAARKQILFARLRPIADRLATHLPVPPLQMSQALSELIDTFNLTKDNCMVQSKEALVVFLVMLMLIDRRSGGEGTVPKAVKELLTVALNEINLSWGDLKVALSRATDPERLFN